MLKTINSNKIDKYNTYPNFGDEFLFEYYNNYFENLSSSQLDREFYLSLSSMIKSFKKLPQEKRTAFVNVISNLIEFYIENKIEKELGKSFYKVLRF